jgi:hypothetical protein
MHSPAFLSESHVRMVGSFEELIATPFRDGVNALCWPRTLDGDFGEVVVKLGLGQGITTLDAETLHALPLSPAGQKLRRVHACGSSPAQRARARTVLNGINGYVQPEETGPVRTDVCSWHADSATAEVDTWLCTYHGASSEGPAQRTSHPPRRCAGDTGVAPAKLRRRG